MNLLEYILSYFYRQRIARIVTHLGSQLYALCSSDILEKFWISSILDARSAGYVAVGLYEESETPILLIVDENESRNIAPAVTEAFYRKFQIIVLSISNRNLNNLQYPQDMFGFISEIDSSMDKNRVNNILNRLIHMLDSRGGNPVMLCINNNNIFINLSPKECKNINYTSISSHKYTVPLIEKHSKTVLRILETLDTPNVFFYIDTKLIDQSILNLKTSNRVEFNLGNYSEEGILSTMIGASIVASAKRFIFIGLASSIVYEINVLGNRHINNNITLCVINDNEGCVETLSCTCATWDYKIYYVSIGKLSDNMQEYNVDNPNLIVIQ